MKIDEIRQITVHFVNGRANSYLIHRDEIDRFIEATKELHVDPGRNPHNGEPTARAWRITSAPLQCQGPYWWTTPGLQRNGDRNGARILNGDYGAEDLWVDWDAMPEDGPA